VGPTATSEAAHVLLGVTGGIAAYKACEVVRRLREVGLRVTVAPTRSALGLVGEATWSALSGEPILPSHWQETPQAGVPHVDIARQVDCVLIAPATAHTLARMAVGLADDALTAVVLTAACPVLVAPAMHTEMWLHPATQANIATLRQRGVQILGPAEGRLTGPDTGIGRLLDPGDLVAAVAASLQPADMRERRVVVTAGGTREPLDDVRFLGNRSSGRQGVALAEVARRRGAEVILIAAHLDTPAPLGVAVVRVGTTAELADAVHQHAPHSDAVVMAAAVADFRPQQRWTGKLAKADGPPALQLVPTEDVLAGLGRWRAAAGARRPLLIGFAAESEPDPERLIARARAKCAAKEVDLIVANDVSDGAVFGEPDNHVWLVDTATAHEVPRQAKEGIAERVWDTVVARWNASSVP